MGKFERVLTDTSERLTDIAESMTAIKGVMHAEAAGRVATVSDQLGQIYGLLACTELPPEALSVVKEMLVGVGAELVILGVMAANNMEPKHPRFREKVTDLRGSVKSYEHALDSLRTGVLSVIKGK